MSSIHQNPMEHVLLRCYNPAKPRWEMQRTTLDYERCSSSTDFILRKPRKQHVAVVQVGFGKILCQANDRAAIKIMSDIDPVLRNLVWRLV